MTNDTSTHVLLARAVIIDDGHLLVATGELPHLPGGHVDPGESIRDALARELREELEIDVPPSDLQFLGCIEHEWDGRAGITLELNVCFLVAGRPLVHEFGAPPSPVPTLTMSWEPLDQLAEVGLLPAVLVELLPEWLDAGPAPTRWSGLR
jgi:8-oxo-dGTP pyrophosphatase MutT (NUDIX family)